MSEDVLAEASRQLRIDASAMTGADHEFLHAVADLIDADLDATTPPDYDESEDVTRMFLVKIARAYVGLTP